MAEQRRKRQTTGKRPAKEPVPDELAIAGSILDAVVRLDDTIRASGQIARAADLPSIRVSCRSRIPLESEQEADGSTVAMPGESEDDAQRRATRIADGNAMTAVIADLRAQAASITCISRGKRRCNKLLSAPRTEITTGLQTFRTERAGLFGGTRYTTTSSARGTLTVRCTEVV